MVVDGFIMNLNFGVLSSQSVHPKKKFVKRENGCDRSLKLGKEVCYKWKPGLILERINI